MSREEEQQLLLASKDIRNQYLIQYISYSKLDYFAILQNILVSLLE